MTQTDKEKLAEIKKLVDDFNEAFFRSKHPRMFHLKTSMARLIENITEVLEK